MKFKKPVLISFFAVLSLSTAMVSLQSFYFNSDRKLHTLRGKQLSSVGSFGSFSSETTITRNTSLVKTRNETNIAVKSEAFLYDNSLLSSANGSFLTSDFATPDTNSDNINIHFWNSGTDSATVTLYKRGILGASSIVDSFIVDAGKEDFTEMKVTSSTTYYNKRLSQ